MKSGNYSTAENSSVRFVRFSTFSKQQLESWSVAEIFETRLYQGMKPVRNSPNDLRLGVSSLQQKCQTCGLTTECQGHFGHIKLKQPVFHYGFLKYVEKVLKCVCHNCFRLKVFKSDQQKEKFSKIVHCLDPNKRLNQLAKLLSPISQCPSQTDMNGDAIDKNIRGCGSSIPTKVQIKNYKIYVEDKFDDKKKKLIYSAQRVKVILEGINNADAQLLGFLSSKPIDLIIETLAVSPPQIRPSIQMNPEKRAEDDITAAYVKIISINNEIQKFEASQRNQKIEEMEKIIASIMIKLNRVKMEKSSLNSFRKKAFKPINKSISQRLKGKQGRFRQHLMGKRVDFSARSVVSPDSNLALDELGVPEMIARNLTVPQQITQWNYDRIEKLCRQGKVKYLLKSSNDQTKYENLINFGKIFDQLNEIQKHLNYGMVVERCLENGDFVLFNRQPTLHRMSMMGHRVKILPYNTFRLNLSVCTPYNADFDGDEMNMHVPQSYQTISQIKHVAHVSKQIIALKNNAPVMGIVQDALLGIYLFTMRDTFLTRQQVMNLVIWIENIDGRSGRQNLLPGQLPMPAIIKPQALWTGKQVISLIIPDKITIQIWKSSGDDGLRNIRDVNMIIRKGQLLSGALQKQVVGSGPGGLVHSIWLEIGPNATNQFITVAQRIVNNWLTTNSFTVGAADVVPGQELERQIQIETKQVMQLYYKVLNQYRNEEIIDKKKLHQRGKRIIDSFEHSINWQLNYHRNKVQDIVTKKVSPYLNNIFKMITAKSKGSDTNLTQILFLLGNQNVDGKRCPLGFSRRALPHFSKDDNSPEPRGYVLNSLTKGLKPHQFFFHSMGGRQGLSDTAVKTSRTGYIQRKLVKSLEDLVIRYDGTVRDSSGNMLQKLYGEDSFTAEYIEKHRFPAIQLSQEQFRNKFGWGDMQLMQKFRYDASKILKLSEQFKLLNQARIRLRQIFIIGKQTIDVEYYCPIKIQRLINKITSSNYTKQKVEEIVNPVYAYEQIEKMIDDCVPSQCSKEYRQLLSKISQMQNAKQNTKKFYLRKKKQFEQQNGLELFRCHLRLFLASKSICQVHKLNKNSLIGLVEEIRNKFHQSLAFPGQAIGSIAAQSIGQPTTQLTLNTFHSAGVKDKNVTLGVPRLQQLLDMSKNIKKPNMTIYLKNNILERNQSQHTTQIATMISFYFPERHIKDYLMGSKIYYDPDPQNSRIGAYYKQMSSQKRTPWIISLIFDKKQLNQTSWNEIINKLNKFYDKKFQITAKVGFAQSSRGSVLPEVMMRCLQMDGEFKMQKKRNQIDQDYFKYLNYTETELKNLFISGIKGIKSVKTSKKVVMNPPHKGRIDKEMKNDYQYIIFEAEGSNLKSCLSHFKIDSQQTYSNDINDIYNILGIEAARQSFINQFNEIIQPYSIYINHRHLSVLADWVSMRGILTPVNRNGINRVRDVSVLRKASYEETAQILFGAAVFSELDKLRGVSEKIIFGQNVNIGTQNFEVMVDRDKVDKYNAKGKKDKQQQLEQKSALLNMYMQDNRGGIETTPIMNTPNVYNRSIHSQRSPSTYTGIGMSPSFTPHHKAYNQQQFTPHNYDLQASQHSPLPPSQTPLAFGQLSNTPLVQGSPMYGMSNVGSSYHNRYGASSNLRSPHYLYQGTNSPNYSSSLRSHSPDYNSPINSSRYSNSPNYTPIPNRPCKDQDDNDDEDQL